MSNDPYSQPPIDGISESTRESALAAVRTPATLLFITGILSIVGSIAYAGLVSQGPSFLSEMVQQMQNAPDAPDPEAIEQIQQAADQLRSLSSLYYAQAVISLIGAVLMCVGASKMKKLQSYGLAMTACIVAIVPFTSACCSCIFPVAIGIWGIVVLAKQDVKIHFS